MTIDIIEVFLPKLGESIMAATVVQWLKKEGEPVSLDEPLLEVSTDKVNSEIPSPVAGILKEIVAHVDQEIEVGGLLAKIEVAGRTLTEEVNKVEKALPKKTHPDVAGVSPEQDNSNTISLGALSPAVLRLAQKEGLSIETVHKISGSGERGRITKKDIESYIQSRSHKEDQKPICPQVPSFSGEERIAMTGMRKMIADNIVRSFYEAPHASLVIEADVTDAMKLIALNKESFFQAHGVKPTITGFLIQALTQAIQQFPMLNASLDEDTIVLKRYVNVGIAVNIDKGLVVPVIKNCQDRNFVSLAKAVAELSAKARTGKLSPDEITEGSVTLTNFGMTGALIGVPIIRYPEVAIIGAGTIQKRVIVREDDALSIRQMMYLTLTFDHRVIDGIYGCQFLAALKQHMESVKTF